MQSIQQARSWPRRADGRASVGADCFTQNVSDFMVVAPYNDQVELVRRVLRANERTADVRVGTVDKFQGQEASVVFFSMTASTASDIPARYRLPVLEESPERGGEQSGVSRFDN